MELIRWDTAVSDYKIYFKRLIDRGEIGIFEVKNESGILFEVVLKGEGVGPYVIVDEEHLTNYWSIKKKGTGSTFIVKPSVLLRNFEIILDPEKYNHYVISTGSLCLEVLSKFPPMIRRV